MVRAANGAPEATRTQVENGHRAGGVHARVVGSPRAREAVEAEGDGEEGGEDTRIDGQGKAERGGEVKSGGGGSFCCICGVLLYMGTLTPLWVGG